MVNINDYFCRLIYTFQKSCVHHYLHVSQRGRYQVLFSHPYIIHSTPKKNVDCSVCRLFCCGFLCIIAKQSAIIWSGHASGTIQYCAVKSQHTIFYGEINISTLDIISMKLLLWKLLIYFKRVYQSVRYKKNWLQKNFIFDKNDSYFAITCLLTWFYFHY